MLSGSDKLSKSTCNAPILFLQPVPCLVLPLLSTEKVVFRQNQFTSPMGLLESVLCDSKGAPVHIAFLASCRATKLDWL